MDQSYSRYKSLTWWNRNGIKNTFTVTFPGTTDSAYEERDGPRSRRSGRHFLRRIVLSECLERFFDSEKEYKPNHSYYFIAPTPGMVADDVAVGEGGVCKSDNIRFIINVLPGTLPVRSLLDQWHWYSHIPVFDLI